MTNPVKKRVVTLDDLNVLNQNAAYARQKGEAADAAAARATTAAEQAELAAGYLPAAAEAAGYVGDAREAAGYLGPLAAAKDQADQNHTRADQDHQQVVDNLNDIAQAQQANNTQAAADHAQALTDQGNVAQAIANTNAGAAIAAEMGSVAPTAALLGQTGAASTASQSNYPGYGSYVGARTNTRRIVVRLKLQAAATKLYLYARTGPNGATTARLTATSIPAVNVQTDVVFDSPVPLTFDWLDVTADANLQMLKTTVDAQYGTSWRIQGSGTPDAPVWAPLGTTGATWYAVFYSLDDANKILNNSAKLTANIRANLAPEITAAVRADTYQALGFQREYAYTLTSETASDTAAVIGLNNSGSSTYYGFEGAVGVRQNFNMVEKTLSFDWAAKTPTQVRIVYRENDQNGTIVAETTRTVYPPTGVRSKERFRCPFYFSSTVVNAAGVPLYEQLYADGNMAAWVTPTVLYPTPAYPSSRVMVSGTITAPGVIATGTQSTPRTGFGTYTTGTPKAAPAPVLLDALRDDPVLSVPPVIYGVVGQELNVYFGNVMRTPLPPELYFVDVTTSANNGVGMQMDDCYRWTPTSAGDTPFKLDVYLGDTLLASASSTLRITAAAGPAAGRNVLYISDSRTEQAKRGAELMNRSALDPSFKLTFQGTRVNTVTDSTGTNRTFKHEGWSGKTVSYHYADPASNFTFDASGNANGTIFDFARYLAVNPSVTLGAGDWGVIDLGTNECFSMTRDNDSVTGAKVRMDTCFAQMEAMIANIQAAVPGIRIAVTTVNPPASTQDAFALAGNGTGMTRRRHKRLVMLWNERVLSQFGGRTANNIYVMPVGHALDTVHGMRTNKTTDPAPAANLLTQTVAARIPDLIERQVDGLHPRDVGYWQMADAEWAFFKALG